MKKAWIKLDGKQWLFDEESWTLKEWFVIKNATEMTRLEFLNGVLAEDPHALRGLVWFLRRKDEPDLRIEEVDFRPSLLDWEAVDRGADASPPAEGVDAATPTISADGETTTSVTSPPSTPTAPAMSIP